MPLFEYFNADGDTGMVVGGIGIDVSFEMESAEQKLSDAKLVTVTNVEELLTEESIKAAVIGRVACRAEDLDTKAS